MSSIRVTRGGDVFRLPCNDTDTLLALLRRAGCTLPAACGGHGRCGKCRVSVNGVPRLACRVVPEDGDEIVLPPTAGGRILTETLDPPAVPTGETGCAAAIDLGTTTTALRLYDLATGHALATCADWTALAPYGADVITRIQYTIDHQDGLTRLSSLLRQQLKALLTRALSQAGRQPAELKRTVTAGNTVMQSLLAGVSVRPLAAAPFCPETFFRQSSGLTLLDAPLYCVPCAAGFVGGDITAGLLASGLARRAGHFLFLDIGTNGEMALGGMDGFTCCAVAAGPAFEGAGIACGMLGVDGAVSRVRYSGAFKMNVIGGGEAVGLCGVQILLAQQGLTLSALDGLYLSGGFGMYLDPASAAAIGMLPRLPAAKLHSVGNAALSGAAQLALRGDMSAADGIVNRLTYLELSGRPDFADAFAENIPLRPMQWR